MTGRARGRPPINDSYTDIELLDEHVGKSRQYIADLKHRLRRKALGLCSWTGCSENATYYCPKHRAYRNEKAREARASLKHKNKVSS